MGKIRIGKSVNHGLDTVVSHLGKFLPVALAVALAIWAVDFAGQTIIESTTDLPTFSEIWDAALAGKDPDQGSRQDMTIQSVVGAATLFLTMFLLFMTVVTFLRALRDTDVAVKFATLRDPVVIGAAVAYSAATAGLILAVQLLPQYAGALGGLVALAAAVVLIYVSIAWLMAEAAAAYEGRSGIAALRRSNELLSGNWWRMLGLALVYVLLLAAVALAMLIVVALLPFVGAGDPIGSLLISIPVTAFSAILSAGVVQSAYADVGAVATPPPGFPTSGATGPDPGDIPNVLPPAQDPPPPGVV